MQRAKSAAVRALPLQVVCAATVTGRRSAGLVATVGPCAAARVGMVQPNMMLLGVLPCTCTQVLVLG